MEEQFRIKRLPPSATDLCVVQRKIPGLDIDLRARLFGFELNLAFESSTNTDYRVMDKRGDGVYYIGNSALECEMWITENYAGDEDHGVPAY